MAYQVQYCIYLVCMDDTAPSDSPVLLEEGKGSMKSAESRLKSD